MDAGAETGEQKEEEWATAAEEAAAAAAPAPAAAAQQDAASAAPFHELHAASGAEVAATLTATPTAAAGGHEGATPMDIDVPAQSIRAACAPSTASTSLSALATGLMPPRGQPTAELEATEAAVFDTRDTTETVSQEQMGETEFEAASHLDAASHQEETTPAAQASRELVG